MKNNRVPFMGIYIDNMDANEIAEHVFECVEKRTPVQVVGVNVDQIVTVNKNATSMRIFLDAEIVFIDGKPIKWMCNLLGRYVKARITGPDLMEFICKKGAPRGLTIFLLGAGPGVADKCGKILEEKYPGIHAVGSYSPPFGFQNDKAELQKINTMLKESGADLLFVGMGSPKQDIFIYENMKEYGIPVSFSMGAALDFIAGNVKRAPRWMVRCGLEWVHRISQNPKRLWKRYLVTDITNIIPMFIKEIFRKEPKD